MTTYIVTMHRIVQTEVHVEANTPEEAEFKANDEVRINGFPDHGYGNIETIDVTEVK